MAITCASCGYDENPVGNTYCDACGVPLNMRPSISQSSPNFSPDTVYQTPPTVIQSPPLSNGSNSPAPPFASQQTPPPLSNPVTSTNSPAPPFANQQTPPPFGNNLSNESITNQSPIPVTPIPPQPIAGVGANAKLIAKQPNYPTAEFILDPSNSIIGKFDPDTGPVDVDLASFPDEDLISRQHGRIYQEGGQWKIQDFGSTNGIFLKRIGDIKFSARITSAEIISSGDEIAIAKIRFIFQTA
jgi:pSer/pThr/pTyr-binding forkhead associated (FHA) protein